MGKSEADLEVELAEAKEEYRGNLDDDKAKQRLHKAKDAVVAARQARRGEGVSVGGDAVSQEVLDQYLADLKAGLDPDVSADVRRAAQAKMNNGSER